MAVKDKKERNEYPLNPTQAGVIQSKVFRYTGGFHFSFALYFDQNIDFQIMQKAVEMEYERNDSLSLKFYKKGKEWRQYFSDSYIPPKAKTFEFDSKDDCVNCLKKIAKRPINFIDNDQSEFIIFHLPKGKSGVMLHISHLIADAGAAIYTLQDLMLVYIALENGTDLPPKMDSFEECLKEDLIRFTDLKIQKRNAQYYNDQFEKWGEPQFTHVLGADFFKPKKAGQRYLNMGLSNLLFTKAETVKYHIETSVVNAWEDFCKRNGCSMESLILLGFRTYLSKINGNQRDVTILNSCNRRSTLKSKNTGGCLAVGGVLRTVIDGNLSFIDAIDIVIAETRANFRHSEFTNFEWVGMAQKKFSVPISATYMSPSVAVVLNLMPKIPNDWKFEMDTFYDGTWLGDNYQVMFHPNLVKGGLDFSITFKTSSEIRKRIDRFLEGVVQTIELGVNCPDKRICDIQSSLDN